MENIRTKAAALYNDTETYLEAHPIIGNILLGFEGIILGVMFALAI